MVIFRNSKYIDMIRVIGENISPINFWELKEKTHLGDSTVSRSLKWLQNISDENGLKSDELPMSYLPKDEYIESTDISKSKNNSYKLTDKGLALFKSLFLEEDDASVVDEFIQDFKIYDKLWNFIENNSLLFYDKFDKELYQWTYQLFEVFEDLSENDIKKILKKIPDPVNIRLYGLFDFLTRIIFTHPLWKKIAEEDDINIPKFNESHFKLLQAMPLLKSRFLRFGTFPNCHFIITSDKVFKELRRSIDKNIKRFYWKGIKFHTREDIIRKKLVEHVFNDLYDNCPQYIEFINEYHIELAIYIKNLIDNLIDNICKNEDHMQK